MNQIIAASYLPKGLETVQVIRESPGTSPWNLAESCSRDGCEGRDLRSGAARAKISVC